MNKRYPTAIHLLAAELRRAGIHAKASKCGSVLLLPHLGGEGVAALRMLHPAVQSVTVRTGLTSKLPKSRCKTTP